MSLPEFAAPLEERRFEDYVPGVAFECGPIAIGETEIVDFAERFDPQDIHTDPEKAARGPFGGLIASGWHTASLIMRVYTDNFLSPAAAMGRASVDALRWTKPVRPGDLLRMRVKVLEASPSASHGDAGTVRVSIEVVNQNRERVMTMEVRQIVRCRNAA